MNSELFQTQMHALENNLFDQLNIIRDKNECFLVIQLNGQNNVLTSPTGSRKVFRHVWQIRNWLNEKFGIDENLIGFKKL